MKKKLTVNTLARGNLKMRKGQYSLLIIGIIFAMVFSSGILFFISCMTSSTQELTRRSYGAQDAIFMDVGDVDFSSPDAENVIAGKGFAHIVSYCFADEGEEEKGAAVAWLDEKAQEFS